MALCFLQKGVKFALNKENSTDYKKSVQLFQDNVKNLRFGYVPGVIRHYYHGTKLSRKYGERWKILVKYEYSPFKHFEYDNNGILVPTKACPQQLLDEIFEYFGQRNEDDIYKDKNIATMLDKMINKNHLQNLEDDEYPILETVNEEKNI